MPPCYFHPPVPTVFTCLPSQLRSHTPAPSTRLPLSLVLPLKAPGKPPTANKGSQQLSIMLSRQAMKTWSPSQRGPAVSLAHISSQLSLLSSRKTTSPSQTLTSWPAQWYASRFLKRGSGGGRESPGLLLPDSHCINTPMEA